MIYALNSFTKSKEPFNIQYFIGINARKGSDNFDHQVLYLQNVFICL